MNDLVPCPDCSRHVRRSETACPFCGTAFSDVVAQAPARRMPTVRLGRAALFTFAAASIGAAACGGDDGAPGPGTGGTAGASGKSNLGGSGANVMALYGAPAAGAVGAGGMGGSAMALYGAPAAGAGAGTNAGGGVMALYGLPAFGGRSGDGGAATAGTPGIGGGPVPAYGVPAPPPKK